MADAKQRITKLQSFLHLSTRLEVSDVAQAKLILDETIDILLITPSNSLLLQVLRICLQLSAKCVLPTAQKYLGASLGSWMNKTDSSSFVWRNMVHVFLLSLQNISSASPSPLLLSLCAAETKIQVSIKSNDEVHCMFGSVVSCLDYVLCARRGGCLSPVLSRSLSMTQHFSRIGIAAATSLANIWSYDYIFPVIPPCHYAEIVTSTFDYVIRATTSLRDSPATPLSQDDIINLITTLHSLTHRLISSHTCPPHIRGLIVSFIMSWLRIVAPCNATVLSDHIVTTASSMLSVIFEVAPHLLPPLDAFIDLPHSHRTYTTCLNTILVSLRQFPSTCQAVLTSLLKCVATSDRRYVSIPQTENGNNLWDRMDTTTSTQTQNSSGRKRSMSSANTPSPKRRFARRAKTEVIGSAIASEKEGDTVSVRISSDTVIGEVEFPRVIVACDNISEDVLRSSMDMNRLDIRRCSFAEWNYFRLVFLKALLLVRIASSSTTSKVWPLHEYNRYNYLLDLHVLVLRQCVRLHGTNGGSNERLVYDSARDLLSIALQVANDIMSEMNLWHLLHGNSYVCQLLRTFIVAIGGALLQQKQFVLSAVEDTLFKECLTRALCLYALVQWTTGEAASFLGELTGTSCIVMCEELVKLISLHYSSEQNDMVKLIASHVITCLNRKDISCDLSIPRVVMALCDILYNAYLPSDIMKTQHCVDRILQRSSSSDRLEMFSLARVERLLNSNDKIVSMLSSEQWSELMSRLVDMSSTVLGISDPLYWNACLRALSRCYIALALCGLHEENNELLGSMKNSAMSIIGSISEEHCRVNLADHDTQLALVSLISTDITGSKTAPSYFSDMLPDMASKILETQEVLERNVDGSNRASIISLCEKYENILWILVRGAVAGVKSVSLTHPQICIVILSYVFRAWNADAGDVYYLILEELGSIAGVMRYLLSQHPRKCIQEWIMPLLQRKLIFKDFLYLSFEEQWPEFITLWHPYIISSIFMSMDRAAYSNYFTACSSVAMLIHYQSLAQLLDVNYVFWSEFLLSDALDGYSDVELLSGQLVALMLSTINATLHHEITSFSALPSSVFKVMRQLIWCLEDNTVGERAQRALRLLCTLHRAKSWKVSGLKRQSSRIERSQNDDKVSSNLVNNVINVLPSTFLYLMSNAIQPSLSRSDDIRQIVSALSALNRLICLLHSSDVGKFLPKIMSAIDAALSHDTADVVLVGVRISSTILSILPTDLLRENLAALVVGVYPIVERVTNVVPLSKVRIVCSVEDMIAKKQESNRDLYIASNYYNQQNLTLCELKECILSDASMRRIQDKARTDAIALINDVFTTHVSRCQDFVMGIPYIPDIPGLEVSRELYDQYISALSLNQRIVTLCKLLHHESVQLRVVALRRIRVLCKDNINALHSELINSPSNSCCLANLMTELLHLASREQSVAAKDVLAQCLGEIGAIDASRLQIKLSTTQHASAAHLPPWKMDSKEFGLTLLTEYIVPSLTAASNNISQTTLHDRNAFAIQEILRLLGGTGGPVMPEELNRMLSERDILDTCEPFWKSKYTISESAVQPSLPIYQPNYTFERWLGLWCRYLTTKADGPFSQCFDACRSAVRTRSDLGQFLLPYLIVDVLLFSKESQVHCLDIIREIHVVLTTRTEAGDKYADTAGGAFAKFLEKGLEFDSNYTQGCHMSIQAVFTLLDTFAAWVSKGLAKGRSTSGNSPSELASASSNGKSSGSELPVGDWENIVVVLKALLEDIPKDMLAAAAMKIGAYARALQYFETHARTLHRIKRLTVEGSSQSQIETRELPRLLRNDGSNGELPVISPTLIDNLMDIYSRLDDTDALKGVKAMQQVYGYESNAWHRITEYEHTDAYFEAFGEYNILQQNLLSRNLEELSNEDYEEAMHLLGAVERGRMMCLVELGQYDTVLNQTSGITAKYSEIEMALLPSAIEASWQLQRWSDLDDLISRTSLALDDTFALPLHRDDHFYVSLGKAMSHMARRKESDFESSLKQCRIQTMSHLAAAAMESYDRSYQYLYRLHCIQEVEQGFDMMKSAVIEQDATEMTSAWHWKGRLELMSAKTHYQVGVMRQRKGLFQACGLQSSAAEILLETARVMRKVGRFDTAKNHLLQAESLGVPTEKVLLQECMLLRDSGKINQALMLLEPVQYDAVALRVQTKAKTQITGLSTASQKKQLAEAILLATKWMVQSRSKQGKTIVERFKLVIDLCKTWEEPYFEFAKYNELLMQTRRAELEQVGGTWVEGDEQFLAYVIGSVEYFLRVIRCGKSHLLEALPKVLSMWFTYSARLDMSVKCKSDEVSNFSKMQKYIDKRMNEAVEFIPAHIWYGCLPQILSRMGHNNPDTISVMKRILTKVLIRFPRQGIWHISSLLHSFNTNRQDCGNDLVHAMQVSFTKEHKEQQWIMVVDTMELFKKLVELAKLQPRERKISFRVNIGSPPCILVPTQAALSICYPAAPIDERIDAGAYFPSNQMYVLRVDDVVDVLWTKAKPKKMRILTTCGNTVTFLVKQERNGDLRKDARMMEFSGAVNKIFQENAESQNRKLHLRTFSVICLNEECGIIEWVPHTAGFRSLVTTAYNQWPDVYPPPNFAEIKSAYEPSQERYEGNFESLLVEYKKKVLSKYKPCFHRWFLDTFSDPTEWYEARGTFTRSCAVWSAVGHIVGLGDRHGDNILIDTNTADCVHVDFDCLFDKGVSLAKPEIVPFRLTPNMVDAFGLTGTEGTYRYALETCLRLLRENKDVLMSVLEPFIRDPTVCWGRDGRAQRSNDMNSSNALLDSRSFQDTENKSAVLILTRISERLDGVYNIRHPHAARILSLYHRKNKSPPTMGLGATSEDHISLSVVGQAQRLIEEATSEMNLMQMFLGWMPWL